MKPRILIVSRHQKELQAHLGECDVTLTRTGRDGLSLLELPQPFDLILADLELADMEAKEFFRQARNLCRPVFIVLVTKDELARGIEAVNRWDIFSLLPLPCQPDMLELVLERAMAQARLLDREQKMRQRIRELTGVDALTGCYIHTVAETKLDSELARARRYNHHIGLLLCDIDHLQQINEQYGHRAGDRVLTGFAQAAREVTRQELDWICRWDGDCFLIVLPETPIQGARVVADRLRNLFDGFELPEGEPSFRLRATIGVTGFDPRQQEHHPDPASLLRAAEQCLNLAKELGGDQIHLCPKS
ncbi:diguanylate cyclase response regulator [Desulfolithobacter dissulfuricans]|uniref:diguanylate cyclase n=1 Tax=Desulfolithobacter dissulfuricans TaxID=2795293 RepID=A0A915U0U9_9BACT|nr:diguanylate cyclase [Desulfolithobacter dissulfuricans]BCO08357.1 diguanylate cyclase response regulator [Desulfolithobacter dissulfuricans]